MFRSCLTRLPVRIKLVPKFGQPSLTDRVPQARHQGRKEVEVVPGIETNPEHLFGQEEVAQVRSRIGELGRASCREREEMSVVAASLTKRREDDSPARCHARTRPD